ncbi:hypothetical protein PTQ33_01025 [Campylobacter sp. 50012-21]|nr:hypothetical protein [Campylobacter magnus]MDD0845709.1 hypothetical protein [Campylobacter magnus]
MINDLDLSCWKELDILTDDLWLFASGIKMVSIKMFITEILSRKFHIN